MTPEPTNEERQAAQEIIFAHPIWNSPNFTTLAIDLRVELTRRDKQIAEALGWIEIWSAGRMCPADFKRMSQWVLEVKRSLEAK